MGLGEEAQRGCSDAAGPRWVMGFVPLMLEGLAFGGDAIRGDRTVDSIRTY